MQPFTLHAISWVNGRNSLQPSMLKRMYTITNTAHSNLSMPLLLTITHEFHLLQSALLAGDGVVSLAALAAHVLQFAT